MAFRLLRIEDVQMLSTVLKAGLEGRLNRCALNVATGTHCLQLIENFEIITILCLLLPTLQVLE